MADFKIWIDISEGSIGGWIGLSIFVVAVLWAVLVLLKLWIICDNMRDDRRGLVMVDRTDGKVFKGVSE